MKARLREKYDSEIAPTLKDSRGYGNVMEIPRITKIVVNTGFKTTLDRDSLKAIQQDMAMITGQKPIVINARKSISNFKLREGMPIGVKVTLRGSRMYEFLDRLINAALPRIRDFRGVRKSFDGNGNYTLGIKEHTIFPEIDLDRVKTVFGMDITLVSTATNGDEAAELLKLMGMPFAEN